MADFKQYLKFDDDGVVDGLDIDKFLQKSVDAGLMSYSEDDGFKVLGGKKMEDFAEGLNLSSGVVQAFFRSLFPSSCRNDSAASLASTAKSPTVLTASSPQSNSAPFN